MEGFQGGLLYLVGRMTSVKEVREYRLDYDPLGHVEESEPSAMDSTAEKTRFEMEMAPHPGTSNMETADDDQERRSQAIEQRRGGQQGCVLRRSGIMVVWSRARRPIGNGACFSLFPRLRLSSLLWLNFQTATPDWLPTHFTFCLLHRL